MKKEQVRIGPNYVYIKPGQHPAYLIQGHFTLKVTGTQTEGGRESMIKNI